MSETEKSCHKSGRKTRKRGGFDTLRYSTTAAIPTASVCDKLSYAEHRP